MNPTEQSKLEEYMAGFVMGDSNEIELTAISNYVETAGASTLNELERTATMVSLAGIDQMEELSPFLRSSIVAKGRSFISESKPKSENRLAVATIMQSIGIREVIAWMSCLAASILTIYFWQIGRNQGDRQVVAAVSREALITNSPDLIQRSWKTATFMKDKSISGDIIWSGTAQSGYMRFVGMPVNDPSISQYQLWIYDLSRDSEPVDGGVFDIKSAEETIVAIQAKLRVDEPTIFAVTVEQPGGVVVSDLDRLSLMAFVDSNKD